MKPINVEILLCLSLGISSSYYRLTETDLLEDYWKVLDQLHLINKKKWKGNCREIMKKFKKKNP